MELLEVATDIMAAVVAVDPSGLPFKQFQPGAGPYGEPQLVKLIASRLNALPKYGNRVVTRRTPDLLIPQEWALEFKIARPFGDNGKEAENWSVNLLHPYPGNVSAIGDCLKLLATQGPERRAIVAIGYQHLPPKIHLAPLIESFEQIAANVARVQLSERIHIHKDGLVHPVHKSVHVFAWEVLGIAA